MKEEKQEITDLDAIVAGKVEESVLEHTAMAGGQDEAVAVEPVGVLRVVPHDLVVEDVSHGRATHGKPRVTRIRLLDGVDRQEPDRVDRLLHQRRLRRLVQRLHCRRPHGSASARARPAARHPRSRSRGG